MHRRASVNCTTTEWGRPRPRRDGHVELRRCTYMRHSAKPNTVSTGRSAGRPGPCPAWPLPMARTPTPTRTLQTPSPRERVIVGARILGPAGELLLPPHHVYKLPVPSIQAEAAQAQPPAEAVLCSSLATCVGS